VDEARPANRRVALKLVFVTVAMFGFGYALVPLYDIICEVTGLNGRTADGPVAVAEARVDESRTLTVQFLATVAAGAPWEFRPALASMEVQPGRTYQTTFYARNLMEQPRIARASPSVAPARAAKYFNKTECFCFTFQQFEPGEGRDMPLAFSVSAEIPRDVSTLTLSYTFFEAKVNLSGTTDDQQRGSGV